MADEMINPCPFCGSDTSEVHDPHGQSSLPPEWKWVVCPKCMAAGPPDLGESGAIAAWNGAGRWNTGNPESAGNYMVWIAPGNLSNAYYMDGDWWSTLTECIINDVTHWQPLPPAPPE